MRTILEIASFLEFLGEPILVINEASEIVFVNSACANLFGYQKDQMLKFRIEDLTITSESLNHSELAEDYIRSNLPAKDMTERPLIPCINSEGKKFDTRISIANARIDNASYGVAILQDYTSIQKVISALESDSYVDVLTSLYNRRYLQKIIKTNSRVLSLWNSIGVLYLDLNQFKPVNDRLGHNAGDEILRTVANRLKSSVRFDDIIFRVGGDEFIVLLNLTEVADKLKFLENISNKICELISEPILVESRSIDISVSIGAGIYPDHKDDLSELIHYTDKAMYLSKNSAKLVSFVNQLPNK